MRTLSKPNRPKPAQAEMKLQGSLKDKDNKSKKGQNKKIAKTTFMDPFHYKIQILSHEESDLLKEQLIAALQILRNQMPIKMRNVGKQLFISFKQNESKFKPALTHDNLVIGIKSNLKQIKSNNDRTKLVIIFYEQKKHQRLEQLLCAVLYFKMPYILMHQDQTIAAELGVRKLSVVGFAQQEFTNSLMPFCTKCMIQIPWLVNYDWIPLKKE